MRDRPAGAVELVSAAEVAAGYDRLAAQLQPHVDAGDCTLLAVMTGGFYPLMQLCARLRGDFLVDYCDATRYGLDEEGGALEWRQQPMLPMEGRTVIIVDDILDLGVTLKGVAGLCRGSGAAAVFSAVQVVKDTPKRPAHVRADYTTGLVVPDRFVFGCGMDLREHWRHLPAIFALKDGDTT